MLLWDARRLAAGRQPVPPINSVRSRNPNDSTACAQSCETVYAYIFDIRMEIMSGTVAMKRGELPGTGRRGNRLIRERVHDGAGKTRRRHREVVANPPRRCRGRPDPRAPEDHATTASHPAAVKSP